MVDKALVEKCKAILSNQRRRILVTGATGFVGSHLAQTLAEAGQSVLATGRNSALSPPGCDFVEADITDNLRISELIEECDVVVHCAADASPWSKLRDLHDVNVNGTRIVAEACLQNDARLVHISSTSMQFTGDDAFNIQEADGPKRVGGKQVFACGYAESKYLAEQIVLAACNDQGLNAIVLRARAVFGPGDRHLLPRVFAAYDSQQLRQIGDGKNLTHLTYIDNLIYAIALAIPSESRAAVCTITGGQPVMLWELLKAALVASGRDRPLRKISYRAALIFAHLLELMHRVAGSKQGPSLTRYTVGLLGRHQTFATGKAKRLLGYEPCVSMKEGIERTIQEYGPDWKCELFVEESQDATRQEVELQILTTGFTQAQSRFVEANASKGKIRLHASIAVIVHPKYGTILFDTGYAPRVKHLLNRWPYKIYGRLLPIDTAEEYSAVSQLSRLGIDAECVGRIIVSHFHVDHIGGLSDFPKADIVATQESWESVSGKQGWRAMLHAYHPELVPKYEQGKLQLLGEFKDSGIGPFSHCHDLFGDQSVRLVRLPGHAQGQIGALVKTTGGRQVFLVADAAWTQTTIRKNLPPTLAFLATANDRRAVRETIKQLHAFQNLFPDVEIVPTHCPNIALKNRFDAVNTACETC